MAQAVTTTDFEKEVLQADKPVLVDFWAAWCGPCHMLNPILDNVGQSLGENAKIVKVNVDENPALAQQFGVSAIPTVVVFKNGQLSERLVGVQPEGVYKKALS